MLSHGDDEKLVQFIKSRLDYYNIFTQYLRSLSWQTEAYIIAYILYALASNCTLNKVILAVLLIWVG